MRKTVKLKLKAWHFAAADFEEPTFCAISIAAMEYFGVDRVDEWISGLDFHNGVERQQYKHLSYERPSFQHDYEKALAANFGKKVIRTIILKAPKIINDLYRHFENA